MFRNSQKLFNEVTEKEFKQAICCLRYGKLQWSFIGSETKDLFPGKKEKKKKTNEFNVS
jgi:hypothetical protein